MSGQLGSTITPETTFRLQCIGVALRGEVTQSAGTHQAFYWGSAQSPLQTYWLWVPVIPRQSRLTTRHHGRLYQVIVRDIVLSLPQLAMTRVVMLGQLAQRW